ncbi:hypothetical protein [Lewinella sp. IMCC34191]|uniref:hypothetical protein n=1 Tax=Lewinella sp. IMCC34191 TaxID=2259172 RepID=UPI000E26B0A6|nr:hypothetical protein [Lewinella sp. IMCC34191]
MPQYLYPLLISLLFFACSEERQTLNRIEGVFETTEIIVTAPGTDSVLFTASPTFQFAACDLRDNRDGQRCPVTIIDTDGTTYDYRYGIETARNTPDYINLRPMDGTTWEIDTDLNRAIHNRLVFELDEDELRMYSDDVTTTSFVDTIGGYRDYDIVINASKR